MLLMNVDLKLSQAIGARICHDLAGCAANIGNCLELIEHHDASISVRAKKLVFEESQNLARLLKFFQVAYGSLSSKLEMQVIEINDSILSFFRGTNIYYKSYIKDKAGSLDAQLARAVICLSSLASERLIAKSKLDLILEAGDNEIRIVTRGNHIQYHKERLAALEGKIMTDELNISNCREYYVSTLLKNADYKLHIFQMENIYEYLITKR